MRRAVSTMTSASGAMPASLFGRTPQNAANSLPEVLDAQVPGDEAVDRVVAQQARHGRQELRVTPDEVACAWLARLDGIGDHRRHTKRLDAAALLFPRLLVHGGDEIVVARVLVGDRKTIAHPHIGSMTLDCDILTVPGADLKLVAYTAPAGSPDAEKLDRLRVAGIRTAARVSDVDERS